MKKFIVRLLQIKKNKNRRDQHKNKQKIIKEIHTIFFPTRGSPFSAITTAHTSPFAAKNFKFPTFLVWASPDVRSQKTTIELVLLLWVNNCEIKKCKNGEIENKKIAKETQNNCLQWFAQMPKSHKKKANNNSIFFEFSNVLPASVSRPPTRHDNTI